MARRALPVAGHALVLVPGIIDGADLKTGGDHGQVRPVHPRMTVQLDAHQVILGEDALDHGRGVFQRQPHGQGQPAMLRSPEPGGLQVDAAAPQVRQLRILLVARQEITAARTAQASRLRALLLAGDDTDRQAARGALTQRVLTGLAGRELPAHAGREHAIRQAEIARLALAMGQARRQLKDNRCQLLAIAGDIAPGLTSRYGIGPVSAAQAIVSFSHPGRCRNEAAFASLGGTSPIPASSGRTVRHRLNRGGDRALNRAIHAIALTRIRSCARTRAYVTRRTAEGKTPREIRRCLKRYIARELYRQLTRSMSLPVGP
jgi:transposase